jgi:hypothetical protein
MNNVSFIYVEQRCALCAKKHHHNYRFRAECNILPLTLCYHNVKFEGM